MLSIQIYTNGVPTYIERKYLAKQADGSEYPADAYLPEPDENGKYQPNPEMLIVHEVRGIETERDEKLSGVTVVEYEGNTYAIDKRLRTIIMETLTVATAVQLAAIVNGETPTGLLPENFPGLRDVDNVFHTLTLSQLAEIADLRMKQEQDIWIESYKQKDIVRG